MGFIEDLPADKRYTKVGQGDWQIHFTRPRVKELISEPLTGASNPVPDGPRRAVICYFGARFRSTSYSKRSMYRSFEDSTL